MNYDLVFEGGGAKGMVFVGACDVFFQRGHAFNRLPSHFQSSARAIPPERSSTTAWTPWTT